MSLPSRGRGLKYLIFLDTAHSSQVAPFTGAWIEITKSLILSISLTVAPFTGAWIEIHKFRLLIRYSKCRSLHGGVD